MPQHGSTRARATPRHIAIIMDGNGRWAQQRGLPRWEGHRAGVAAVREAMEGCNENGVEVLTLFSFSSENWRRSPEEVGALMSLLCETIAHELDALIEQNIRLHHIGDREALPPEARAALELALDKTSACTGQTLCLALNYGARAEIVRAARLLAEDARAGKLNPADIDEESFASRLYTNGLPDPDLLIRTAGEMRVSNYLLWQISYAEIVVTDTLWPDFTRDDLRAAIDEFTARDRRFGAAPTTGQ